MADDALLRSRRVAAGLAERAAAILQDEIAHGALANIAEAQRHPLTHATHAAGRRLAADLEQALDTLLDLLAPGARAVQPVAGVPDLPSPRSVRPGQLTEILTRLLNDGPRAVDLGFRCSDLVSEAGGRIPGAQVRLRPRQLHLPPGTAAELAILLEVPPDASPGVYRGLVEADGPDGPRARLTLRVGDADSGPPV